jgi:hypothetical protein
MYAPIHFPPAPARVREQAREPRDTLTVTTWLTTRERQQVEAANCGCLRFVHRGAATALGPDLAGGKADAALVSVALLDRDTHGSVAALARGFPAHLVAALVSEADDEAHVVPATLKLGRIGVGSVLDVRTPAGWSDFRRTFDPRRQRDGFMRTALASVLADVGGQQAGMHSVLLRGVFTSHAKCQAPGRAAWGSPFDADESFLSRRGAVAQDVPHVRAARVGGAP